MVDSPKAVSGVSSNVPDLSDKHVKMLRGKTVEQIKKIFPTAHIMDYDKNGKFDAGDTIDLENTSDGTTKSYHIIKKGELGSGIAGTVESAVYNARQRFTMRTKDKTFDTVKKSYVPSMENFDDANNDGKFNQGDSITEKLPDGRLRKYYFVKSGDIPSTVYKKVLGPTYTPEMVQSLYDQNHTNGDSNFDADKVVFYTFPKKD